MMMEGTPKTPASAHSCPQSSSMEKKARSKMSAPAHRGTNKTVPTELPGEARHPLAISPALAPLCPVQGARVCTSQQAHQLLRHSNEGETPQASVLKANGLESMRPQDYKKQRTLCDPMDCSLPGSSVHGIVQARTLEWVAFPSPGDLPDPGIEPESSALAGAFFTADPPGKPETETYIF